MRFDGGVTMVKLRDLPVAARQGIYDPAEEADSEARQLKEKEAFAAKKEALSERMVEGFKMKNVRIVAGKEIPKSQFAEYHGVAKTVCKDGVVVELIKETDIYGRGNSPDRMTRIGGGAGTVYRPFIGTETEILATVFVRNLPETRVGEKFKFDAVMIKGEMNGSMNVLDFGAPYIPTGGVSPILPPPDRKQR